MKKKSHKKRKSNSEDGQEEVDPMFGFHRKLHEFAKGSLIHENETSNSDTMDDVDGGATLQNEEIERVQPKNGIKNAIGNRDEAVTSIDENGEHQADDSQPYPFRWLNAVGAVISTVLFLVDVVTDILLAVEYNDHGRILECVLTSSVVVASFLVAGILSTIWYVQDSKGPKNSVKSVLFLVLAFPFSTLIRNLAYLKHGCLSRKASREETKAKHYKQMIKEDANASLLRMFDAFVESAPQLIIQIYLAIHDPPNETLHLEILRCFTIGSSLLGLAWSVTSYYRVLRIFSSTTGVRENTICGGIGYFLWRLFEIGPRITAIVMLILVDSYGLYITFGAIFHWMIMSTMAYFKNVKVYTKTIHNILFISFISFVQIVSFMNLSHERSRYYAIIYYSIFYAENAVMVALFVFWTEMDKSSWIFITTVCVASSGTLFCSLFMILYYKLCHPKVSSSNDKSEEVSRFIVGGSDVERNVE